jgi:hypothetical protein
MGSDSVGGGSAYVYTSSGSVCFLVSRVGWWTYVEERVEEQVANVLGENVEARTHAEDGVMILFISTETKNPIGEQLY